MLSFSLFLVIGNLLISSAYGGLIINNYHRMIPPRIFPHTMINPYHGIAAHPYIGPHYGGIGHHVALPHHSLFLRSTPEESEGGGGDSGETVDDQTPRVLIHHNGNTLFDSNNCPQAKSNENNVMAESQSRNQTGFIYDYHNPYVYGGQPMVYGYPGWQYSPWQDSLSINPVGMQNPNVIPNNQHMPSQQFHQVAQTPLIQPANPMINHPNVPTFPPIYGQHVPMTPPIYSQQPPMYSPQAPMYNPQPPIMHPFYNHRPQMHPSHPSFLDPQAPIYPYPTPHQVQPQLTPQPQVPPCPSLYQTKPQPILSHRSHLLSSLSPNQYMDAIDKVVQPYIFN